MDKRYQSQFDNPALPLVAADYDFVPAAVQVWWGQRINHAHGTHVPRKEGQSHGPAHPGWRSLGSVLGLAQVSGPCQYSLIRSTVEIECSNSRQLVNYLTLGKEWVSNWDPSLSLNQSQSLQKHEVPSSFGTRTTDCTGPCAVGFLNYKHFSNLCPDCLPPGLRDTMRLNAYTHPWLSLYVILWARRVVSHGGPGVGWGWAGPPYEARSKCK